MRSSQALRRRAAPLAPKVAMGPREIQLRKDLALVLAVILLIYACLAIVPILVGEEPATHQGARAVVAGADIWVAIAALRDRLTVMHVMALAVALLVAASTPVTDSADLGPGNASGAFALVALAVLRQRWFPMALASGGLLELACRTRLEGLGHAARHLDDFVIAASICLAASAFVAIITESASRADAISALSYQKEMRESVLRLEAEDSASTQELLHDGLLAVLDRVANGVGSVEDRRRQCAEMQAAIEVRLGLT